MENATKALIIAGSILIAILLISMGLAIFNSTKGVVKQGEEMTDVMQVNLYNEQFTKYCGDKVVGSQVKDLQNFVESHNAVHPDQQVKIELNGISIKSYIYYNVKATKYDVNGYTTEITISNVN